MGNKSRIPAIDALLFVASLEFALLQMKVIETLARCKSRPNDAAQMKKLTWDKLAKDRKFVMDFLTVTLIELVEQGQWCSMEGVVEAFRNNEMRSEAIRNKNGPLRLSLENIKTDLETSQRKFSLELENINKKIFLLRDQLKDCAFNTTVQLKYSDAHLNARTESLERKLQVTRAPVPRVDHEDCVHKELLRAYHLQIEEKEELLDNWQTKYVQDIATINERLKEQREKYNTTTIRRKELEDLYTLHQGEMRGWLTFKRERAARLAREERTRKAVVRIQAWWRGLLVRRCLGSFRFLKNAKKVTPKPKKK